MRGGWLAAALLVGCGGRPAVPVETAGAITWVEAHGGAFFDGCRAGDELALLSADALERWALPRSGPPERRVRTETGWPTGPRPVAVRCTREVVVEFDDGSARRSDAIGWQPADANTDGMEDGITDDSDGMRDGVALGVGARRLIFERTGWRLLEDGVMREQRGRPGDFADGTWDGTSLWAVGPSGLWRWQPGQTRWAPVTLPGAARGRALSRIWRDGPFLWVVDDTQVGYALEVAGSSARLARDPGPVRLSGAERTTLLAGRRVAATLGGTTLSVDEGAPIELGGRVSALGTLGDTEVLLGVGGAIERWDVRGPTRVGRWAVGGATRRLIATPDQVFAIGSYGVLVGRLPVAISPDRAADPSAPPSPAPAPSPAPR